MSTQRALSVTVRPLLSRQSPLSASLFQKQSQQRPLQQTLRFCGVLSHTRVLVPLLRSTPSASAIGFANVRLYSSPASPYAQSVYEPPPPPEPEPKKRSRTVRAFFFLVRATLYLIVGQFVGYNIVRRYYAPNGPVYEPEFDNLEDELAAERIAEYLLDHPFVQKLNNDPDLKPTHPHYKLPHLYRRGNLTAGTLVGPDLMAVPPLTWQDDRGERLVMIMHVGRGLCGHPNIVHGGFVATVLDEFMARCCFKAVPHGIAMTARLNIDYRAPTPAGSYVVLTAETVEVDRRKAVVRGRLQVLGDPADPDTETGALLAEAEGLFVSPREARALSAVAKLVNR
ncbi:hypothetical protein HMPREF1624_03635 [Sporothrix schenckii ATCC 58251]|uniref:Thioesterase domain-containing protein n=2 Tax=Sporothrix schenckii TaxID=29908 RepID=U7PX83_SPOS1|nr:hypothetical protein HMPREF1624_03635 [Sporothrix schenckii ATCC 58251]